MPKNKEVVKIREFLIAAKKGYLATIIDFIEGYEIDVNSTLGTLQFGIPAGTTALMLVAGNGHKQIVEYLLCKDFDLTDDDRSSEEFIGRFKKRSDLLANIDLTARNSNGHNALDFIMNFSANISEKKCRQFDDIGCLLLDAVPGADDKKQFVLMGKEKLKDTPALLLATEKRLIKTVYRMLKIGIPYNREGLPHGDSYNPLQTAIMHNVLPLVKTFMNGTIEELEYYEDEENPGRLFKTKSQRFIGKGQEVSFADLELAAGYADFAIVETVIHGLDEKSQAEVNLHSLMQLALNHKSDVIDYHERQKIVASANMPTAKQIIIELVNAAHPQIMQNDHKNRSLLFDVVQVASSITDSFDLVNYLVNICKLSATQPDVDGITPIAHAANSGGLAAIPALFKLGALLTDITTLQYESLNYTFKYTDPTLEVEKYFTGSILQFFALNKRLNLLRAIIALPEEILSIDLKRAQMFEIADLMRSDLTEFEEVLRLLERGSLLERVVQQNDPHENTNKATSKSSFTTWMFKGCCRGTGPVDSTTELSVRSRTLTPITAAVTETGTPGSPFLQMFSRLRTNTTATPPIITKYASRLSQPAPVNKAEYSLDLT